MDILVPTRILGAIICFLVEAIRNGFSLTVLGFLFLSLFLALAFIPSLHL